MKVYIATYYQYDNYGTRLQNFALCQSVQALGAQPITLAIRDKRGILVRLMQDIFSSFPLICSRQRIWLNNRIKRNKFSSFNGRLCLQVMGYGDINKLNFDEAIAVAGSDQIWSPKHIIKNAKEKELYFLRFAPREKRFAYAPSFGTEELCDELRDMYQTYISDFKQLSVRETAGQKIIKELTGMEALVLPDPTFLLNSDEWRKAVSALGMELFEGNYVLTYFLSEQSKVLWENINNYAKERKLRVVCIAGNQYKKGTLVPAPDEFVKLVEGAKAVFTDSFHGSVFSIIMQTPFVVFRRSDVDQLSRIDTLLQKYELTKAFLENENVAVNYDAIFTEENFTRAGNIMAEERQKGLDYLKKIIQSCKYDEKREKYV